MKKFPETVANIFSNLFNAYFSLALSLGLVLFKSGSNIVNPLFIFIFSILFLFFNLVMLKKFGIISDWEMKDRRERPIYGLTALIPYSFILYFAFTNRSSEFISIAMVIFILNILLSLISVFWKISGHMIYLTLFGYTTFHYYNNILLLILMICILVTVAWSRVYLKRHTVLQVIFGTILSLITCFIIF